MIQAQKNLSKEEAWLIQKIRQLTQDRKDQKTSLVVEHQQGGFSLSMLTPKGKISSNDK